MSRKWIVPLGVGLLCLPLLSRGGDWPQFRGPDGAGLSSEEKLPFEWGKDKNVLWKAKIPGYAWSQPVIWGDKVFVTTAVSDKQRKPSAGFGGGFGRFGDRPDAPKDERPKDAPKDQPRDERPKDRPGGFRPGGRGGSPPDAVYKWEVYCLDRASGKVLWHQTAVEKKPTISTHSSNTYASETPVTDGERVYAYFGMTGVYCFDFTGKQLWSKELGSYRMMAGWGTGSSPALDGDRLYIQCDNEEKSFLVALDKKTGKELWRVNRTERSSWSTPFVWRNKKRTEVVCAGLRVRSYDPASGKQLWELSMDGPANMAERPGGRPGRGMGGGNRCDATPVASDELLYVGCSGSFTPGPLFAVKAGASGDISLKDDQTSNEGVAWRNKTAGPSMASPVLYNGHLYVLEQRGSLSCFDAKTGKEAYRKERLAGARQFTSSLWAYDGKVFCLDEDGQTFVVKAGPEFKLLGKNRLDEMFWSSAAVSGGSLYLRGVDHLYCIK
jgi:outer membrane protein assembly factor BamB